MFHVSDLRKCVHDPSTIVESSRLDEIELEPEQSSSCGPTRIVEHGVKRIRNKEIKLVRVQWRNDPAESTWETEEKIMTSHPELFTGMFHRLTFHCLDIVLYT